MKYIIRSIAWGILLAFSIFTCICVHNIMNKQVRYCGKVISKECFPGYAGKYASYDSHVAQLLVKFDKIGYHNIKVTTNTYHTTTIGELVCFDLTQREYEEIDLIFERCVFVFFLLASAASLILLAVNVAYTFPE